MMIVFGNIKGGTGKSTLAVHVCVALMMRGFRVVTVDYDGEQGVIAVFKKALKILRQEEENTYEALFHLIKSLESFNAIFFSFAEHALKMVKIIIVFSKNI